MALTKAYADKHPGVEERYMIGGLSRKEFQSILYLLERAALSKKLLAKKEFPEIMIEGFHIETLDEDILVDLYTVGSISEPLFEKINILTK